jgi:hypothetical protein
MARLPLNILEEMGCGTYYYVVEEGRAFQITGYCPFRVSYF